MQGYNLMQAIARVNRVFGDKEGGLVVDYVGIAAALKQAMNDYTARDKKNYGDTEKIVIIILTVSCQKSYLTFPPDGFCVCLCHIKSCLSIRITMYHNIF